MATKSKLKGRDPATVEPSKPKIVVYGKPGVGKTWAALDFPNVFYIDTEGGADLDHYRKKLRDSGAVYFGPDDGSLDFNEVIEQVQALATEDHDRKTLVIDSLSKLFNNQISVTQDRMVRDAAAKGKEYDPTADFGASKKEAIGHMRRMVAWLDRLDMNVILIHHEKSTWKDGKEVGTTFDSWDKLEYELHLVIRVMKNGPERRAYVGKTRLEQFPDGSSFLWSFAEFAKRYGEEVIGRKSVRANLCTDEQKADYNALLLRVKVQPDTLSKWEAATPDIALLDADSMQKRLDWLNKQLAAQTAAA
jgi:hypothetical protein